MAKVATKTATQEQSGPDRFLQFTISGNYYNSKKEMVDFDNVVGKIPYCDEENQVGSMHVRGRYATKWVKEAKDRDGNPRYPERIGKMRQVFIDDVVETTGTLSFVGKDIKELDIDELQDLAVAKDLRFIPLPGVGMSLRDILIAAYVAYSEKILMKKIKWQDEGFNFAKLPSIILDAKLRRETAEKITNDEMIEIEAKKKAPVNYGDRDDPKQRFTLDELKELADGKNIEYNDGVEFDELYSQLFTG